MLWEELLKEAEVRLRAGGVENPAGEARRMAASALGCEDSEWFTVLSRPVGARGASAMESMLRRRTDGEPLQYVLGSWGFRTLDLMVNRDVFIPRPETEVLAGIALEELRRCENASEGVLDEREGRCSPPGKGGGSDGGSSDSGNKGNRRGGTLAAADLGCGSGAIGLSLAAEHPSVEVYCTDVSADALAVARANLAGLGESAKRVRLSVGSWYEALPDELRGQLSAVVSNPPYIAEGDPLPPSVEECEPALALRSGATGLEDIRTLLAGAPAWLSPGGAVVLETPESGAEAALAMADEAGLTDASIHQDLALRNRVLVARRSSKASSHALQTASPSVCQTASDKPHP